MLLLKILLLLLFIGLPHEKPKWEYLTDADWAGILGLILGLGGLTGLLGLLAPPGAGPGAGTGSHEH